MPVNNDNLTTNRIFLKVIIIANTEHFQEGLHSLLQYNLFSINNRNIDLSILRR